MKIYKLVFKQVQPIHIGAGSYGIISETRIFIPGWTMWGALTKAYNLQNGKDLSTNQNLFENISCFYPSFNEEGNDVLCPSFKNGDFYLGEYSEKEFRAKFVDTYISTAVLPESKTAKDESLREVDVILPRIKREYFNKDRNYEKQLYWVGILKIDKNIKNSFLKEKELGIYIGGDVRYGLGLMELEQTYEIDHEEANTNNWKAYNYIPVKNGNIKSKIELLVEAVGYNGADLQIKKKGFYYVPARIEPKSGEIKKGCIESA